MPRRENEEVVLTPLAEPLDFSHFALGRLFSDFIGVVGMMTSAGERSNQID
jgi:hypothetical protein